MRLAHINQTSKDPSQIESTPLTWTAGTLGETNRPPSREELLLEIERLKGADSTPRRLRNSDAWQVIEPAIDGLKELMFDAAAAVRGPQGAFPEDLMDRARVGLELLCQLLTRELGTEASIDEDERQELGALVRRELHPYLLLTRIVERIYTKPRGYAGDFLTIRWMYENEAGGVCSAGHLIDQAFLERPAAKAVRNRRGLLVKEIEAVMEQGGRVTSLACGPAEELFDVLAQEGTESLRATCLDIDLQALAQVADRRDEHGLKGKIRLEQANLIRLATGRDKLELAPQDLIYSIGLIDYFQDRFVVALLNWIHDQLAPGGRVVLGNFHPRNPDRALMDHVLDWRLVHRDEADMNRLFQSSKFGAPCAELRFEAEGVNLFAIGYKSPRS